MNKIVEVFLNQKRIEYERAEKCGHKMLMEVIRQAVKKTTKKFEVKLQPGQQYELF